MARVPRCHRGGVAGLRAWLSAARDTYAFVRCPYGSYRRWGARGEEPLALDSLDGPIYLSASREGLRALFELGPWDSEVWATNVLSPLVGPSSLNLVTGDEHTATRKALSACLERIDERAYAQLIETETLAAFEGLRQSGRSGLHPFCQRLSLRILMLVMFRPESEAKLLHLVVGVEAVLECLGPALVYSRLLRSAAGVLRLTRRFEGRLDALKAQIRSELEARHGLVKQRDLAGYVLEAARGRAGNREGGLEWAVDQLLLFIFAGHETTGAAVSWTLYWLKRQPKVEQRARREVVSGVRQGPTAYTSALCKEVLRISPVVTEVSPRRVVGDHEVQGVTIPAGGAWSGAIYLAHQNEGVYPDPAAFKPERFLAAAPGRLQYLPFGGGNRKCIGARFATVQHEGIIHTVLAHEDYRLLGSMALQPHRYNLVVGVSPHFFITPP